MRLKLTILLLVLNAALFGLIYYMEKSSSEFARYDALVFQAGVVENAARIEIRSNVLNQAWVMEREKDGWSVSEPINWPANPYAATRILNQLQFLEKQARFSVDEIEDSGRTLEHYGLVDPNTTITIHHPGGRSSIGIGDPTGIGNRLYILSPGGDEVFVVNRELLESISIDIEDLRKEEIFQIPLFEVRSMHMTITNPGNLTVRLARENNAWRFETPIETAADSVRVEAMLNSLTRLKVRTFESADPVRHGLDDATLRIRLTIEGNNRRQTILVGNRVPGEDRDAAYYAQLVGNPTVFTVPAAPFNDLLEAQEALRERIFVQIDPNLVDGFEIRSGTAQVVLQKLESGKWQIPFKNANGETARWTADSALIGRLLNAVSKLEATAFISDAPAEADLVEYGFGDPQRIFSAQPGPNTSRSLILGDMDSATGRVYAKMHSQPFVYQVDPEIVGILQVRPLYFRDRVLRQQPSAAHVRSIRLTRLPENSPVFSLGHSDQDTAKPDIDPFAGTLAGHSEAASAAMRTLRDFALRTEVSSYLTSSYTTPHRSGNTIIPWRFRLDAEILLPGGSMREVRELTVFLSERLGATAQIGASPQLDSNFTLTQEVVDALFALTFDRKPVTTPEGSVPDGPDPEPNPPQPAAGQNGADPPMEEATGPEPENGR